jgi:hypothetical protein
MASTPALVSCSPEDFQASEPVTLPTRPWNDSRQSDVELTRVAKDEKKEEMKWKSYLCGTFDVLGVTADEGGVLL